MRKLAVVLVAAVLFAACGGDKNDDASSGTPVETTTSTTAAASSAVAGVAMWPDADTVFRTPEEAARDFVSKVLDVPPSLGLFHAGDARSGEIAVFYPGEGRTNVPVQRATLVLRQLGPKNGWFVISAGGDGASITNLSTGDTVSPGSLKVMGRARGFEGNVVVSAYVRGDDVELGKAVTQGGSMAETEPFSVNLDLAAPSKSVVFVVVRGGTGVENDPGDFAAIPLVVQ